MAKPRTKFVRSRRQIIINQQYGKRQEISNSGITNEGYRQHPDSALAEEVRWRNPAHSVFRAGPAENKSNKTI